MYCSLLNCSSNDSLSKGTFVLYENNEYVCDIYRLDNYQIEKCQGDGLLYAKLKWESKNSFILEGLEKKAVGIDTLNFLVIHKKIEKDKYYLTSTPLNTDIDYEYKAILIKKSSKIEQKYLDTLISLNESDYSRSGTVSSKK